MKTKRIVVNVFAGIGAKDMEAWIVPADISEEELSDFAWDQAVNHAESYGIYNPGEASDWEEGDEDAYYNDLSDWECVEGWWEPYDSEKHDGRLLRGCDTEVHWNQY